MDQTHRLQSNFRVLTTIPLLSLHNLSTRIRRRLLQHRPTGMRQLHHNFVAKQTVDLFETEALGLGATVPDRRHKHHGHDDEDEVVAPSDLGHSESETLEIWDRRQHEDRDTEAHAFGAQVRGEDLGAVDVDCCVDEAGETVVKEERKCQCDSRQFQSQASFFLRGDVGEKHCYRCSEAGFVVRPGIRREERGFDCDDAGSGRVADYCHLRSQWWERA